MSTVKPQFGQPANQIEINITPDALYELATMMREKAKVCYPGEKVTVPLLAKGRQLVFRYDPEITTQDVALRPRASLPGTEKLAQVEKGIQDQVNRDEASMNH